MTFLIGFLVGGLLVEVWRGLLERREDAFQRPRCWICGKTFGDWRGVHFHCVATHPLDDSQVMEKDRRPYR
jgi:hypothetical protein